MAKYKTLLQIYDERPDLQKAFPTKGRALDDWWNTAGKSEYPDVTLVQPGDKRLTVPAVTKVEKAPETISAEEGPALLDIYNARPDVQAEFQRRFPGQNPTAQGTEANRALNDWYNEVGRAEGADMVDKGLISISEDRVTPTADADITSADYSKFEEKDGTIINIETGEAYSKPGDLARDLGIDPNDIDWSQIKPATEELPTDQITIWKDGQSTIIHRSEWEDYAARGYTKDQVDVTEIESITGDENLDKMYEMLQDVLDKLIERGQTIDPTVEITPEKVAEFMAQAEREIDPYYASQMGLARESMLTSLGYSKDDLSEFESSMEKKYGKQLRVHGEEKAEMGFARSGRRLAEERELAEETQLGLEAGREGVRRGAGEMARSYAQLWGAGEMPAGQIGAAPRVIAGEAGFRRDTGEAPMYTLDDEIYEDLVGSKQWEQEALKKTRVSELEKAFKTSELEKRQRELTL